MKIAIDLDGVLVEWNHAFADLLQTMTGRPIDRGLGWPQVWRWPQAAGVTKDEIRAAWKFIDENPDWWAFLDATPDALLALTSGQLLQLTNDHDVYFVTNRWSSARRHSEAWLYQHLGTFHPVISCTGNKGPLFDALDIDVALDDKPENLLSASKGTRLVLIDAPYNQWVTDHRLERMTLTDILDELVLRPTVEIVSGYEAFES